MGNRAVITASTEPNGVGIYLHWNGGLESVLALLDAAKAREFCDPSADETYAMARLCGLCHELLGTHSTLSLGIGTLDQLDCDNWDNGVYVIGKDWSIVSRWGDGSRTFEEEPLDKARESKTYKDILEYLTKSV